MTRKHHRPKNEVTMKYIAACARPLCAGGRFDMKTLVPTGTMKHVTILMLACIASACQSTVSALATRTNQSGSTV